MLEKARYAAQLLRRRKIIAAARAAFTFPIEDIPPDLCGITDDDTVIMREGYRPGAFQTRHPLQDR